MNLSGPADRPEDKKPSGESETNPEIPTESVPGLESATFRPRYLSELTSVSTHTQEARDAVKAFMKRISADHFDGAAGVLMNATGTEIKGSCFLAHNLPDVILEKIKNESFEIDDSGESNLCEIEDSDNELLLEQHFPDLSTSVLAVGILPNAKEIYFVTFHRTDHNDLMIPSDSESGLDFKTPLLTSSIGLLGVIFIYSENTKDGITNCIKVGEVPYLSHYLAVTELAALASDNISDFIISQILSQPLWREREPNKFALQYAQYLPNGNLEAYISLSEVELVTADNDSEQSSEQIIAEYGAVRIVTGYLDTGIFGITEYHYFPANSDILLDSRPEATENISTVGRIPELETLALGEQPVTINPVIQSRTDGLWLELRKSDYRELMDAESISNSRFGSSAVNISIKFVAENFKNLNFICAECAFERFNPEDNSYEYVVAISSCSEESEESQFLIVIHSKVTTQQVWSEPDVIGLQFSEKDLTRELSTLIVEQGQNSILNDFLIEGLPNDIRERQQQENFTPLRFELGIRCPQKPDSDMQEIAIYIYDTDSEQHFIRTIHYDSFSGLIPLNSIFSFSGITNTSHLSKNDAVFWIDQEE